MRNTRLNSLLKSKNLKKLPSKSNYNFRNIIEPINSAKWIMVLSCSLFSILSLYKYLCIIGHPELGIKAISDTASLAVWLFFCLLCGVVITFMITMPTIIFSLFIFGIFPEKPHIKEMESFLKIFLLVIIAGFILWHINLFLLFFTWYNPHPLHLITVMFLIYCSIFFCLLKKTSLNSTFCQLKNITNNTIRKWHFFAYSSLLGSAATCISLSVVFPAQIILQAWRGGESNGEALCIVLYSLIITLSTTLPALVFYGSKGIKDKVKWSLLSIFAVIILNIFLLPAIVDIWVFSAANLLTIRNTAPFNYIFSKNDYPKEIFKNIEWNLQPLENEKELYSIGAFSQFSFGDIQLLCPAKYSHYPLKKIGDYSAQCISVSASKIKVTTSNTVSSQEIKK